jgi:hypothetical protein
MSDIVNPGRYMGLNVALGDPSRGWTWEEELASRERAKGTTPFGGGTYTDERYEESEMSVDPGSTDYVTAPGAGKMMAQGGIITEATHVVAGEAGPEVIFPLDDWRSDQDRRQRETLEAMRREVDRLVEALGSVRDAASGDPFAAGMGV